jgi:hypothetical protein
MSDPESAGAAADAPDPSMPSSASPDASSPSPDDLKAKFREALQRKRGDHPDNAADSALRDGSKIHGEHGRAGGGRTFRRKSGG